MFQARFSLGRIGATQRALTAFVLNAEDFDHLRCIEQHLNRHCTGDWGELDDHAKKRNEVALTEGHRIISKYHLRDGSEILCVTEGDRRASTFMVPHELKEGR